MAAKIMLWILIIGFGLIALGWMLDKILGGFDTLTDKIDNKDVDREVEKIGAKVAKERSRYAKKIAAANGDSDKILSEIIKNQTFPSMLSHILIKVLLNDFNAMEDVRYGPKFNLRDYNIKLLEPYIINSVGNKCSISDLGLKVTANAINDLKIAIKKVIHKDINDDLFDFLSEEEAYSLYAYDSIGTEYLVEVDCAYLSMVNPAFFEYFYDLPKGSSSIINKEYQDILDKELLNKLIAGYEKNRTERIEELSKQLDSTSAKEVTTEDLDKYIWIAELYARENDPEKRIEGQVFIEEMLGKVDQSELDDETKAKADELAHKMLGFLQ